MRRIRYTAKRVLGPALTNRIGTWKHALHSRLAGAAIGSALVDDLPWCSPNTFEHIVGAYRGVQSPYIHEYGSGASTLRHLKVLLELGGTLVSAEHDSSWAIQVRKAAHKLLAALSNREALHKLSDLDGPGHDVGSSNDFECRVCAANGKELRFVLKLRPPREGGGDRDGTAAQYGDYVITLDRPANVVIVDGRARKACIQHVLDNQLLRAGGALALFEAGRGVDGWLDAPALDGTSNYQPEVERMMSLGAKLIDGTGYDSWPGQLRRRSFGSLSKRYPLELCILQLPVGIGIDAVEAAGRA